MSTIHSLGFTFRDNRNPKGIGRIIGPGGRIFNHVTDDTNKTLRIKFIVVFISNIPLGIILKFTTRCVDLLIAGSFIRGIEKGKNEFRYYAFGSVSQGQQVKPRMKHLFITKCILTVLIKDVIKIASFPLYLVGLQFASIVGVVSPLHGLLFTSEIEELWDQEISKRIVKQSLTIPALVMKIISCNKVRKSSHFFYTRYTFYSFPCLLSQQIWKKHSLYRLFTEGYNPGTLRSLKLKFENLIHELTPCLKDSNLKAFEAKIDAWTAVIQIFSRKQEEADEVDQKGNLLKNAQIEEIADSMSKQIASLEKIREEIDKCVDHASDLSQVNSMLEELQKAKLFPDAEAINTHRE